MQKPPQTVRELMERWLEHRARNAKHARHLYFHIKPTLEFFGDYTLAQVCEPYEMPRLCREFMLTQKQAPNTIRKRLSYLRAAFKWGWREKGWTNLPVIVFPERVRPQTRILTNEERERILAAADAQVDYPHLRTFAYLIVLTRQNKTPIVNLTWDRVRDGFISFDGEYGGDRVRVRIDPRLQEVLDRAKEERRKGCNYVVQHNGRGVSAVHHGFKTLLAAADLREVTMHDIRRVPKTRDSTNSESSPQVSHLFISHSNSDGLDYAKDLVTELVRLGRPCWAAYKDMKAGRYPGQLGRAIDESEAVLLMVTPGVADNPNVLQEIMKAHRVDKLVIPIIVDGAQMGDDIDFLVGPADHIPWKGASGTARAVILKLERD